MKISAIILAAGKGKRFKSEKQFYNLGGKKIIDYSIEKFRKIKEIKQIILTLPKKYLSQYSIHKKYKDLKIISGGKERYDSVKNSLNYLLPECEYVLIHDAVRPFFSLNLLKKMINSCKKQKAVIPAIPVKDTIKLVEKGMVKQTLERKKLFSVQTPQIFEKNLLLKAYNQEIPKHTTDDSYLIEKINFPVKVVKGEEQNIKITTPQDIELAKSIIRKIKRE